jgi:DNA-binding NarL/FixJ family response regulator
LSVFSPDYLDAMNDEAKTIRVLVADDDEDIRELLADMVNKDDSVELVGTAEDAISAVSLAEETEPDVAVLDWMMPNGGGPKAAEELKSKREEIRIVGISAGDPFVASTQMGSTGAVAFLEKGFSRDELIEAIHSAVRW